MEKFLDKFTKVNFPQSLKARLWETLYHFQNDITAPSTQNGVQMNAVSSDLSVIFPSLRTIVVGFYRLQLEYANTYFVTLYMTVPFLPDISYFNIETIIIELIKSDNVNEQV